MGSNDTPVRLDLNNPVFQEHLLNLQKPERNAAIDTLRKIRLLAQAHGVSLGAPVRKHFYATFAGEVLLA